MLSGKDRAFVAIPYLRGVFLHPRWRANDSNLHDALITYLMQALHKIESTAYRALDKLSRSCRRFRTY